METKKAAFKLENMDKSSIKTQSTIDFITGGISAAMFVLTIVLNWFLAFSSQIVILFSVCSLLFLLAKHVIKNPRLQRIARYCLIFCGVMVLLSAAGVVYTRLHKKTADKNTILCDYTETALDGIFSDLPWMEIEKLQDNTTRFYVGTRNNASIKDLCDRYTVLPSTLSGVKGDTTVITPIFPVGGAINANSKTQLIAFNTAMARPGFEDDYLKPLPASVNQTVAGLLLMNRYQWGEALHVFGDAFNQDNGVAGYYLYFAHANGLGAELDRELATQYLRKSADLGYRKAQLEYGQQLLAKGGDIDIALGEKYLRKATHLSEFRTPPAMVSFHKAIEALQDYYIGTEQYRKAYSFTKDIIKETKLEYLTYQYHLDNCLRTGRYSEALDIIQKGIKSRDSQEAGYCKVVQAKMFHEGLGVNKDLRKAELALRFASDSLDYPYARKMLAEFYSQEGHEDDAAFWQRLFDIRFRSTIEE